MENKVDEVKYQALQMAIAAIRESVSDAQIVARAKAFEDYLRGAGGAK